ncbi:MAG: twin-arginine translocase TatA/TatE family subunit [Bacteroidales bacterium]|nr:twin-arginine translocase TatA/TatE family subunit [Bacteroidales bacterium]
MMTTLFLGGLGTGELLLIVLVILLLFGGKKLPEMMRGMGRGVKEFKDAMEKPISDDEKKEEKKDDKKD